MPGLRPDKALRLYKDLGITSLEDLEPPPRTTASEKPRGSAPPCRPKSYRTWQSPRTAMHRPAALLEHPKESLAQAHPELERMTIAGDFRRGCELVTDFAIVAETQEPGTRPEIQDSGGLKLYLADRKHFGAALLHAKGSPPHLEELRALAEDRRGRCSVRSSRCR